MYSTKLSLYVFFALTAVSIVGSYTTRTNLVEIPQNLSVIEKIFKTYDIFHSWWFSVLIATFTINLILCTIHHFLPQLKIFFSKEAFNEKAVESPWVSGEIKVRTKDEDNSSAFTAKTAKIKEFLTKKGFRIIDTKKGVVAEKGRYSRLLPFMFHFSILIILIGGLIGSLFGFVGTTAIHVTTEHNQFYNWTTYKDDTFDFTVRVDDFILDYYPIDIQVGIKDKAMNQKIQLVDMKEKQFLTINNSPYKLFILDSVIDDRFSEVKLFFTLYKDNKPVGDFYSNEINTALPDFPYEIVFTNFKPPKIPKTVRAKMQIKENGAILKEGLLEPNHPFEYNGKKFFFTTFDRDSFSFLYIGMQITYDPAINIVYAGFILMMIAVIPIFFVSHKKIYLTCAVDAIVLTGEATKDKRAFREEFTGYLNELKNV